jgi:hypothetical protein
MAGFLEAMDDITYDITLKENFQTTFKKTHPALPGYYIIAD